MDLIATMAAVMAAGLTIAGLAGSALELAYGRRLTLSERFVQRDRLVRSIAVAGVAGPLMVTNDILRARRDDSIGFAATLLASVLVALWLAAAGVVGIELAMAMQNLLAAGR